MMSSERWKGNVFRVRRVVALPALILAALFVVLNCLLVYWKVFRYYDDRQSTFDEARLERVAQTFQNRIGQLEQIVFRIGNNAGLSEMLQDRSAQSRQWLVETLNSYNADMSVIERVTAVSERKSISTRQPPSAPLEDILMLEDVQHALLTGNGVLLSPSPSESRRVLDLYLNCKQDDYLYLYFQCFELANGETAWVFVTFSGDLFRQTLEKDMFVWNDGRIEAPEGLNTDERTRALSVAESISSDQVRGSVRFLDERHFVFYLPQTSFWSQTTGYLRLVLIGAGILAWMLSCMIILRSMKSLENPIQELKTAAESYSTVVRKERSKWRLLQKRKRTLKETAVRIVMAGIFVPILILNLGINLWFRHVAENMEREQNNRRCEEISSAIENLVDERLSMIIGIGYDTRMQQALRDNADKAAAVTVLNDYCRNAFSQGATYVYDKDANLIASTDALNGDFVSAYELIRLKNALHDESWYMDYQMHDRSGRIRFFHWIGDKLTTKTIGILQTSLSVLELQSCWANSGISFVDILDGEGNTIYSSSLERTERHEMEEVTRTFNYWKQPIGRNRWSIVVGISNSERDLFSAELTNQQFLFLLVLLLSAFLLSNTIAEQLLTQITRLEQVSSKMYVDINSEKTTTWEFPEDFAIQEFSELGHSFNLMAERIEALMDQIYVVTQKKEEMKRQKELVNAYALQAQINPHFLYNTLESINCVIALDQKDKAMEMTSVLGSLFRYSAKQDQMLVPLSYDIEKLNEYLYLMNIRLQDKVQFHQELPEDLQRCQVIKLLLQPILENVCVHALRKDPCDVYLRGRKEHGDLVLCVEDHGAGMHINTLRRLNARLRSNDRSESIGLYNVNDRLRIMFGQPYGVRVESIEGKGTKVFLKMPWIDSYEAQRINTQ